MFIKYVYDHNNDFWIIKVGDNSYYLTRLGPKMVKSRYDIIILCCKVFLRIKLKASVRKMACFNLRKIGFCILN